jgi:hypothetical protein
MAADYAGALAATRQRFTDYWAPLGVERTPYGFLNPETDPKTADDNGQPIPWTLFEIVHVDSYALGRGVPGNNVIIYPFLIKVHIFVPTGSGTDTAEAHAIAAGEIFRNKIFYDTVTAGCQIRSGYDTNGQPRLSDGDITSNDGEWFTITCTIPSEYWHRG